MANTTTVTFVTLNGRNWILSDDKGTPPITITAIGSYEFGDYEAQTTVVQRVTAEDDPTCFQEMTVFIDCPVVPNQINYQVIVNPNTVNETDNSSAVATVSSDGDSEFPYYFEISGAGIDASDFNTPITGSGTSTNQSASVPIEVTEDFTPEGTEIATITFWNNANKEIQYGFDELTIEDTSDAPPPQPTQTQFIAFGTRFQQPIKRPNSVAFQQVGADEILISGGDNIGGQNPVVFDFNDFSFPYSPSNGDIQSLFVHKGNNGDSLCFINEATIVSDLTNNFIHTIDFTQTPAPEWVAFTNVFSRNDADNGVGSFRIPSGEVVATWTAGSLQGTWILDTQMQLIQQIGNISAITLGTVKDATTPRMKSEIVIMDNSGRFQHIEPSTSTILNEFTIDSFNGGNTIIQCEVIKNSVVVQFENGVLATYNLTSGVTQDVLTVNSFAIDNSIFDYSQTLDKVVIADTTPVVNSDLRSVYFYDIDNNGVFSNQRIETFAPSVLIPTNTHVYVSHLSIFENKLSINVTGLNSNDNNDTGDVNDETGFESYTIQVVLN